MHPSKRKKQEPRVSGFWYVITRFICGIVARVLFRRKFVRNEIKGKKGPFVIIANHQAALDFVNLIGASRERMAFVISSSFYNTVPVKGIMRRIGVIPKQQFQTSVHDIRRMKGVIDNGGILVIYPAGLMCEDGRSTPIPTATYRFLQWLKTDVYVARTSGAYFVTPKWRKRTCPGRTLVDVYRLFDKETLTEMPLSEVKEKTDAAILFDAYREQEDLRIPYRGGEHIAGLENVLYRCPACLAEHTMRVENKSELFCTACGFRERSDRYGFLHKVGDVGEEIRYVSDISRGIYEDLRAEIEQNGPQDMIAETRFHLIDYRKKKYVDMGGGTVTLTRDAFLLEGELRGAPFSLRVPIDEFASLPFRPGVCFEVQDGETSYRCVLKDGRQVMKFVNTVKIYYELSQAALTRHEIAR